MSLFYAPSTSAGDLLRAMVAKVSLVVDSIDFPAPSGGQVVRQLAVPYLPGADDIDVTAASLRFQTNPLLQEVPFTTSPGPSGQGIRLRLLQPAFLRSIELEFPAPPTPPPGQTLRAVIRAGTGNPPAPLLAEPSFPAPGPMYPRVLAGLRVTSLGGNRWEWSCSGLMGTAWLLQLALASSPTDIAPLPISPTLRAVKAEVVPSNLAIHLETQEGEVETWANPTQLLPSAGVQEAGFLAPARRQLQALLQQPQPQPPAATLPLRLVFRSESAGSLQVLLSQLQARYQVFPAGREPAPLSLGGHWTQWTLSAPSGIPAESTALDLRIQTEGRELNGGSPDPPPTPPAQGLRVTRERWVAAALPFLPNHDQPAGTLLPLASIRLYLGASEEAEVSLELRNDLAGNPGPQPAAPRLTRRLPPGDPDWIEFLPPKPIPVSSGQAPLWIVLRTTRGSVAWYASPVPQGPFVLAERLSVDEGQTWSVPDRPLAAGNRVLAQFFHQVPDPAPAPIVNLLLPGASQPLSDLLAGATRQGPREFLVRNHRLPAAVTAAFASRPRAPRTPVAFRLYSRTVATLSVQRAVFTYNPSAVPPGEGLA